MRSHLNQTQNRASGRSCPTTGWQKLVGSCPFDESGCRLREIWTHAVLGRITRGFAHKLANDLATVQAAIELIGAKATSDPTRVVGLAQNALDNAAWLLHQIQAITDQGSLEARRVDLRPIVEDVARLLGQATKGRLEIRVEIAEDLPVVIADPGEIREALTILFSDCIENFLDSHAELRTATLMAMLEGSDRELAEGSVNLVQLELSFYPGRAWERNRVDSAHPLSTHRIVLAASSGWLPGASPT